ncbi:uncharacterized protein LOC131165542 isoform X2 [Malania oleifera]|uniref:uncharacterized protein LOC131165542 isoform X2 n=1 Tax=Malania oleifera TaxID=397392 RepID=UPI0025AE5153|nr:uncharacterized protein LOC131165542 isoform X2 [Malania oleifera]
MHALAALRATYIWRRNPGNFRSRSFSSNNGRGELSIEEQAERKIGWLLKLFFAGTASVFAYQFFPYMDERRMKIVEMGGAQELINMLEAAKDDRTRKEALKALAALSNSDEAVRALHDSGAISVISSTPDPLLDGEVMKYKSTLLKRFKDLRFDVPT